MADVTNQYGESVREVLRSVFGTTDHLFVVDPGARTVEELIDLATTVDGEAPTIRLLVDGTLLKELADDFLVASNAADLVDAGSLTLRTVDDADNTLLITDDTASSLVFAGDSVAALVGDDEGFVADVRDAYETRWEDAAEYTLRTPAISRVRETMEEELGADVREDFDRMLDSLDTASGDGEGLDEVTISLLVAARNEVLLYDISRWGEDVGIASKATFSRTKTELEELGLVDTEKVPIDVGRPRLRLKLGSDRLRNASPDELASVAQRLLSP